MAPDAALGKHVIPHSAGSRRPSPAHVGAPVVPDPATVPAWMERPPHEPPKQLFEGGLHLVDTSYTGKKKLKGKPRGARSIRSLVSKKKRRFQQGGFDLDLSYITPQVIAMGFPSEKLEGTFRNPMSDVQRFLFTRHHGHYRVYNLCSERQYELAKFEQACEVPFDDHNPPRFQMLLDFCRNVSEYVAEHPYNVAAVHCKAGKGRTGTTICAWMVAARMFARAVDSMDYFALMRTHDSKGITIPSQRRWVHYTEYTVRYGAPEPLRYTLQSVQFSHVPVMEGGRLNIVLRVTTFQDGETQAVQLTRLQRTTSVEKPFEVEAGRPLCGDVKIEVRHKGTLKEAKMFHLWVNTRFIAATNGELRLPKALLDKACKDKTCRLFQDDFVVTLRFALVPEDEPRAAAWRAHLEQNRYPLLYPFDMAQASFDHAPSGSDPSESDHNGAA